MLSSLASTVDLQLLGIGTVIIGIIAAIVSLFLFFGNRERSFDEVYGTGDRRTGLSILLSDTAAEKLKTGSNKDKKKKDHQVQVVASKKLEKKRDVEDVVARPAKQKSEEPAPPTIAKQETHQVAKDNVVDDDDDSSQVKNVVGNNAVKKKVKKEKAATRKPADDEIAIDKVDEAVFEVAPAPPLPTQLVDFATVKQQKTSLSAEKELEPFNIVTDDATVSTGHPLPTQKKKKQKQQATVKQNQHATDVLEKMMTVGHFMADNSAKSNAFDFDSPLNAALRQLNMAPLSADQLEVVSNFYAEQHMAAASSQTLMDGPTEKALLNRIDEKEHQLNQEKQRLATTIQTINNLNQELFNEKQRVNGVENSFKEQLRLMQSENQQLNQQIRDFQNQMASKLQAYHQMENQLRQIRSVDQSHNVQLQQLREENQRYKERMSAVEQEMLTRNSEVQRLKQELLNRDSQVMRLEQQRNETDQMRTLQETNALSQQVHETKSALMIKEQECNKLDNEVASLRQEYKSLEHDFNAMKSKFDKEINVLTKQQAVENDDSQQELERLLKQMDEMKRSYQAESVSREKSFEEMCHKFAQQDQQYNQLMEEKDSAMHKIREENQNLKNQIDNLSHDKHSSETSVQKNVEKMQHLIDSLKSEQERRSVAEAQIDRLKSELNGLKEKLVDSNEVEQLGQQLEHLDATLARRNAAIKTLEEQLKATKDYESRLIEMSSECDRLSKANEQLSSQLKLAARSPPMVNGHASTEVAGVIIDPSVLETNEVTVTHLNKMLINRDTEVARLKQDIEAWKMKNEALREEKYKAVEAVHQMEKNIKALCDKSEAKVLSELVQTQHEVRKTICPLLSMKYDDKVPFKQWLHDVEPKLKQAFSAASSSMPNMAKEQTAQSENLNKLMVENSRLKASRDSLKNMLQNTERLLSNLEQKSVDFEKRETEQETAFQKVGSQLHSLKELLEREKQERDVLLKELEERKKLLEKERLTSKDLSAQVVKWKGMVKIGQDAYKEEQDSVEQLDAKLKALQKEHVGNGSFVEEVEELRQKLQQKEMQLVKEMSINKQLNNKLASLGIAGTSFAMSS